MMFSCIVGWYHGDPVVGVSLLLVVIVGVVESLVGVVLGVNLSLWIKVFEHFSVSISVSQLWVVVERNSREWVEVVWVDGLSFWHSLLVSDSLLLSGTYRPLGVYEVERSEEGWVKSEVRSIAHSTECGECI